MDETACRSGSPSETNSVHAETHTRRLLSSMSVSPTGRDCSSSHPWLGHPDAGEGDLLPGVVDPDVQGLVVQLPGQESMPEGADREGELPAALELDWLVVEAIRPGPGTIGSGAAMCSLMTAQRQTESA